PSFEFPERPTRMTDHIFSEKFSCPVCGISFPEIEPRIFSFNSPHGACPACTGLGRILTVDPDLVINANLTISEGGILPFAKMFFHDTWFSRIVRHVAHVSGIDPKKPLGLLTETQRKALLYGTGDETYDVVGSNRFGETTTISEAFTGIIPELTRRYRETESDFVRSEIAKYMRDELCQQCHGTRLKPESLTVTSAEASIAEVADLSITQALAWADTVMNRTTSVSDTAIKEPILKEILARLSFLKNVGLEYLTISRTATTLSGGEAQRIRLASQIGSGLSGVLYVLDEPSIGLHQRDNQRLIHTLKSLRDLGNTVIVVEHDREMMEEADYLVDFGPGAGINGGSIVAHGALQAILDHPTSLTGKYLKKKSISGRKTPRVPVPDVNAITLVGARGNNLKNVSVSFPLGSLISVTGVSGSGKSTLVVETLYPALLRKMNPQSRIKTEPYDEIKGAEFVDKIILIDQAPIGRTPRSNPATYTGVFSYIRELFAERAESKNRGYKPGRFSFNVKGGRCEVCEGEGLRRIEMQFLSDIYVTCESCHGSRYNSETLEVHYHDKNIAEILDMTIDEALKFFSHDSHLVQKLETLVDVGLSYMHLGQAAPTLSGGEAQRVKLATELGRKSTGKTLYVLDEPTTGLHFADLEKLLQVLIRLTDMGNTVIVIEHNLDIIKNADWIVDLGPEGGDRGGFLIAQGTPAHVASIDTSATGHYLKIEKK
ncbi:MAG: excinuclease ABC subunit UvrA, partial [bacterium]|nr:excinuclease ABC subunit UvrA [bacterium]